VAQYARRADEFGLSLPAPAVDFPKVMERVQAIIRKIEPHDSVERYTELGVNCVHGDARIVSPWEVEVNGERISARHIVIASGARPRVPAIEGLESIDYLTSDTVWDIREQPRRLLVLGAGPIGCELAQAFAGLGSEVTLVTHAARVLPREDEDVSQLVQASFAARGIHVLTGTEPRLFRRGDDGDLCLCETPAGERELTFDRLLLAVGRTANVEGMGLEELGVGLTAAGTIEVDDYLATAVPTISACGDVAGPYLFTHMASHQAWYAAVNALFGRFRRFRVDYSVVPWATFTDPEVGRVGLNELEAAARGIPVEVTCYDIDDLDRAIADGEASGFVKVLTAPGSDRVLGATIVGYHAAELLAEFVLAMKHGIGLQKILGTIHVYPTLVEANKFAAGEWRKARKPERLLRWVERFHTFGRR
jgi:pyruvate/2-oxoglutarate dehydrogenase complex dihydrolipoamide dehydrogenase (E3) component